MKRSLYRHWMVRLQMFLAARETHPSPTPKPGAAGQARGAVRFPLAGAGFHHE